MANTASCDPMVTTTLAPLSRLPDSARRWRRGRRVPAVEVYPSCRSTIPSIPREADPRRRRRDRAAPSPELIEPDGAPSKILPDQRALDPVHARAPHEAHRSASSSAAAASVGLVAELDDHRGIEAQATLGRPTSRPGGSRDDDGTLGNDEDPAGVGGDRALVNDVEEGRRPASARPPAPAPRHGRRASPRTVRIRRRRTRRPRRSPASPRRLQDAADLDRRREMDARADLRAGADERVRVDHRSGDRRTTPALTYAGGITTTPSPQKRAAANRRSSRHDADVPAAAPRLLGRQRVAIAKMERRHGARHVDAAPEGQEQSRA